MDPILSGVLSGLAVVILVTGAFGIVYIAKNGILVRVRITNWHEMPVPKAECAPEYAALKPHAEADRIAQAILAATATAQVPVHQPVVEALPRTEPSVPDAPKCVSCGCVYTDRDLRMEDRGDGNATTVARCPVCSVERRLV